MPAQLDGGVPPAALRSGIAKAAAYGGTAGALLTTMLCALILGLWCLAPNRPLHHQQEAGLWHGGWIPWRSQLMPAVRTFATSTMHVMC